jgi:hypothetical protein
MAVTEHYKVSRRCERNIKAPARIWCKGVQWIKLAKVGFCKHSNKTLCYVEV